MSVLFMDTEGFYASNVSEGAHEERQRVKKRRGERDSNDSDDGKNRVQEEDRTEDSI